MADETTRALGTYGGGYQVVCKDKCTACDGKGRIQKLNPEKSDKPEEQVVEAECEPCAGLGEIEKTWKLSDISLQMESEHVAFLHGRLRASKISAHKKGLLAEEIKEEQSQTLPDGSVQCKLDADQLAAFAKKKLEADIDRIDAAFELGTYSFGSQPWCDLLQERFAMVKLYQLCLQENHPEVKSWTPRQVEALVESNDMGFVTAMKDILPKARERAKDRGKLPAKA